MDSQRHSFGRTGRLVAVASAVLLAVTFGLAALSSAGRAEATATAAVECIDGAGSITVEITEGSIQGIEFDVFIDAETVDSDVFAGTYVYAPYADGEYSVQVNAIYEGTLTILDDTLTVACTGAPTTTTTTVAPTTVPIAPPAVAAAGAPSFTG